MITDWLRDYTRGMVDSMAWLLHSYGLNPNTITLIGMGGMFVIGLLLAQGYFLAGGLLMAIAGSLDALDGGLARLTNRVTKFGAFLDSTTDRWAEAAIYGGLIWWYIGQGAKLEAMLVYVTIIGSLLVSYIRARAEALDIECKVGIFTRFERIAVLGLGLLFEQTFFEQMLVTLILLAVISNFTALQRLLHVYNKIGE
jgi:CDP-diacylglycerol--glycerol-3-phosphate 3-phosphatidyltransferase